MFSNLITEVGKLFQLMIVIGKKEGWLYRFLFDECSKQPQALPTVRRFQNSVFSGQHERDWHSSRHSN